MPRPLSTENLIKNKNKLTPSGAFVILLELEYNSEEDHIYLAFEGDVSWNGKTWKGCYFSLGDLKETKEAEQNTIPLSIVDINRSIISVLDDYNGGIGCKIWIRIVNTSFLNVSVPLREEYFEIIDSDVDSSCTIKFSLGMDNLTTRRSPRNRFLKSHCRYKEFKGAECGYAGLETTCNGTLARCEELGNVARFGGFPGVGQSGIYK